MISSIKIVHVDKTVYDLCNRKNNQYGTNVKNVISKKPSARYQWWVK